MTQQSKYCSVVHEYPLSYYAHGSVVNSICEQYGSYLEAMDFDMLIKLQVMVSHLQFAYRLHQGADVPFYLSSWYIFYTQHLGIEKDEKANDLRFILLELAKPPNVLSWAALAKGLAALVEERCHEDLDPSDSQFLAF